MFRLPLSPAASLTVAAALLMALTTGTRSSFGLFVSPLNTSTGIGLASIALAAALGQLAWGFAAPLVGWLADRYGARRLIVGGLAAGAATTAALVVSDTWTVLALLLVLGGSAGSAAGSNALLLGAVGRQLPPARRAFAAGIVGAGGSAGQMVLAPLTALAIATLGWHAALWATAALMLAALPLARPFGHLQRVVPPATNVAPTPLAAMLRTRDFWLVAGAFGVCGFHVSFLTVHMPGVIERCGLPAALGGPWLALLGLANIAGSIGIAPLLARWGPATTLTVLYASRGAGVAAFLAAPTTLTTTMLFALAMGLTYMAVLPPMNEWLSRRFGLQHLSTLIGVTMVVHQCGAFAGVWVGGLVLDSPGGSTTMWLADIVLAALATAMHLPLRRRPSPPSPWRPALGAAA